jgi:FKBP-type peptidyl-prolyl cis-trans isomerase
MKKIAILILAAVLFASCQSVSKPKDKAPKADAKTEAAAVKEEKVSDSFAFGLLIGDNMRSVNVTLDYAEFTKGLKAGIEAKDMKITLEEANTMAQAAVQGARAKQGESNIAAEKKYLEDNKKKKGVIATASGLQYEVLKEGTGAQPAISDTVSVDYEGKLLNGKVFDSSIARGEPVSFRPDQVIAGWTEALQLMKVGSTYILYIPAALAYGSEGAGTEIGPNEMLIFEVRLLGIEKAADAGVNPAK